MKRSIAASLGLIILFIFPTFLSTVSANYSYYYQPQPNGLPPTVYATQYMPQTTYTNQYGQTSYTVPQQQYYAPQQQYYTQQQPYYAQQQQYHAPQQQYYPQQVQYHQPQPTHYCQYQYVWRMGQYGQWEYHYQYHCQPLAQQYGYRY